MESSACSPQLEKARAAAKTSTANNRHIERIIKIKGAVILNPVRVGVTFHNQYFRNPFNYEIIFLDNKTYLHNPF